jgi:hypothetical protein
LKPSSQIGPPAATSSADYAQLLKTLCFRRSPTDRGQEDRSRQTLRVLQSSTNLCLDLLSVAGKPLAAQFATMLGNALSRIECLSAGPAEEK